MSIEKNLQTLADSSERIATALEGILAVINGDNVPTRLAATAAAKGAEPSGVTSAKDDAAESEAAAKAEKVAAAKAEKVAAAKKEAAAKAAEAEKAKNTSDAVSYDSIKAVVTELAGKGPDGITAIKGVLKDYGAAKASDVPEDKWGELLAKFEKAKATLEGGNSEFA